MFNLTFVDIIDYLGTFAFAISGLRLASEKQFDLFGAFIVGLATAVGGGTMRDVMIGVSPFWMTQWIYLFIVMLAVLAFLFLHKFISEIAQTIFLFDTIGLGLFTIVGIQKTYDAGFPLYACIIMGVCTGAAGGVIRDIPWSKTFVVKSVEYQRDVVPIHFSGQNSKFFYRLANFSDRFLPFNLAMLFLVDEMYKNVGKTFEVKIGKPIPWQTFDKSKTPLEWAKFVQDKVYEL